MATSRQGQTNYLFPSIRESTINSSILLKNVSVNTYTQQSTQVSDINRHQDVIKINFCEWLDYFMYWYSMWILQTYHKKYRNRIINCVGILFSVASLPIWGRLTYNDYGNAKTPTKSEDIITMDFETTHQSHDSDDDDDGKQQRIVLRINIILFVIFGVCTRLLSMYYLLKEFNFPWHSFQLKYSNNINGNLRLSLNEYLTKHTKRLNRELKVYIIISMVFFVVWTIFFVLGKYHINNDHNGWYWAIIDVATTFFGIQFPMVIFPMIWSVIAIKYQFRLYYLQCLMNTSDNNTPHFVLILKTYKSFYNQFKNKHKKWNWYFITYCFFYGVYVWIYTDVLIDPSVRQQFNSLNGLYSSNKSYKMYLLMIFGGLGYFMPFVLYTISSSKVNHQYNRFVDLLWKYDEFDKNNDLEIDYGDTDDSDDQKSRSQDKISIPVYDDITSMESQCLLKKFGSKRKNDYMDKPMDRNELTVVIFNNDYFHSLLEYVQQFPIQVRLLKVELTPYVLLKFVITFVMLKYIAYNITSLEP